MVVRSRRGFLGGAAALAAGLLTAGCGRGTLVAASHPDVPQQPPRSATERRVDVEILTAALMMERRAIAAYAASIPLLAAAHARWAQAFVGEEIEQAGALAKLIALTGSTAPAQDGEPQIGHPRDGAQALALLAGLERAQLAAYLGWIPRLSAGTMRAGVATILASDAQHLTALRSARGQPALISPLLLDGAV